MLGHMRPLLARVLAALFAAAWIVFPGFGAVDLSVTWSSDWPQVLEAGWGLFFTLLVGAAFVALAFRPCSAAPVAQLAVAALALAVSVVAGREAPLAWVPVWSPSRRSSWRGSPAPRGARGGRRAARSRRRCCSRRSVSSRGSPTHSTCGLPTATGDRTVTSRTASTTTRCRGRSGSPSPCFRSSPPYDPP